MSHTSLTLVRCAFTSCSQVPDVKLSKAGVPPTGSEPAIAAAASLNEKPTTKSPAAPVAMAGLGALVWGKVGRHPWWPATIIELGKKTSTKKTVRFFGDEVCLPALTENCSCVLETPLTTFAGLWSLVCGLDGRARPSSPLPRFAAGAGPTTSRWLLSKTTA